MQASDTFSAAAVISRLLIFGAEGDEPGSMTLREQ